KGKPRLQGNGRSRGARGCGKPPGQNPVGRHLRIDPWARHHERRDAADEHNGDQARKQSLVDYGFRLPSAMDNRPLKFDEFEKHMGYTIYTTATPGPYELAKANQVVDQIIRPTGLVDPQVEIRPTTGQVDDLLSEIKMRAMNGERVLVTTLTKRMSEDLSEYLMEMGVKVQYLHSEVETLERISILRDLRLGVFDCLVGINLLREGLDLPEVSLVAILDADKQGFLRSSTALIQTIGRAARHLNGKVIMYADKVTDAMATALDETNRRRTIQENYNKKHGIEPMSIMKEIHDLNQRLTLAPAIAEQRAAYEAGKSGISIPKDELLRMINELEKEMKQSAKDLQFERAAVMRDQLFELRSIQAEQSNLPPWKRAKLISGEIAEDKY
ncbi:MAG: hypothetical protein HGA86_01080, partial [Anaerolineaceae bacterium]|nr:hypothetical protein [Anaerolineaceae bacterium]